MCNKPNTDCFLSSSLFLISPPLGPSRAALCCSGLSVLMPVMYDRCSPPVISYRCLRLHQPASSPATSQPTSTSLLLGQRLSRGYFFGFSHLLSFILLSISFLFSLFLPLLLPIQPVAQSTIVFSINMSVRLRSHIRLSVSLPHPVSLQDRCSDAKWSPNYKVL